MVAAIEFDGLVSTNVTTIEDWLAAVRAQHGVSATKVRSNWGFAEDAWKFHGAHPSYTLEVCYSRNPEGIIDVRLGTQAIFPWWCAHPDEVLEVTKRHVLEGYRVLEMDEESWCGVVQMFHAGSLRAYGFRGLVTRLAAALDDIVALARKG
jgi:hypothetical protein